MNQPSRRELEAVARAWVERAAASPWADELFKQMLLAIAAAQKPTRPPLRAA